jgi:diguanylate cyclase (GGDEF)-like protein
MRNSRETPTRRDALDSELLVARHGDREIVSQCIPLLVTVLVGVISLLVPKLSSQLRVEIGFAPQLLIGFLVLALIFNLHLASQRKLLREVSTALLASTSYINRLEQFSFIDPQTQLFNRRYLDQLFNQQLKWLNRSGRSVTLLLLEVLPDGQKSVPEEFVVEAAFVLKSNFRGSDYVVRNSTDQFLVLLPDTTEDQAQCALNRLIDKVDDWNLEKETPGMVLRHELSTCPPGGSLWETLRDLEPRLRDKPDSRNERAHSAEARSGGKAKFLGGVPKAI